MENKERFSSNNGRVNIERLAKKLGRFYSGEAEALKRIQLYLKENPGSSQPQIFQALAHRRGQPSTHMSNLKEGDFIGSNIKIRRKYMKKRRGG